MLMQPLTFLTCVYLWYSAALCVEVKIVRTDLLSSASVGR
ncbi:hypothetical protein TPASS_0759 [Treponema pallidum subsp. pallidum SS14]|uniref:Uncharacterized protein TP_0759 n=2 Tax=Treponema pallidum subsp. pallidum TaxID=161 RepID=Y759_TREPA|nr:RecName: Full=Uncharacterized protein TP_0759 [Treponema pallidum subsp. pallidum str. Nichols]AAC65731.1 predicted coding region TP0759 [Treponema pallidum subsp. pallidum str. Nichols]ACD71177.1 hypothetical protein TPASS_0759 [Treponema pallidum subsp. pallidum SS14]